MNNILLSYRFIPAIGLSAVMIGRKNGKNSMIPGALSGDHEYRDESRHFFLWFQDYIYPSIDGVLKGLPHTGFGFYLASCMVRYSINSGYSIGNSYLIYRRDVS